MNAADSRIVGTAFAVGIGIPLIVGLIGMRFGWMLRGWLS